MFSSCLEIWEVFYYTWGILKVVEQELLPTQMAAHIYLLTSNHTPPVLWISQLQMILLSISMQQNCAFLSTISNCPFPEAPVTSRVGLPHKWQIFIVRLKTMLSAEHESLITNKHALYYEYVKSLLHWKLVTCAYLPALLSKYDWIITDCTVRIEVFSKIQFKVAL